MTESKEEMNHLGVILSKCNMVGNPREWWMNFDALRHVFASKTLFVSYAPTQSDKKIFKSDSAIGKIEGTCKIFFKMTPNKVLTLTNILHVLEL